MVCYWSLVSWRHHPPCGERFTAAAVRDRRYRTSVCSARPSRVHRQNAALRRSSVPPHRHLLNAITSRASPLPPVPLAIPSCPWRWTQIPVVVCIRKVDIWSVAGTTLNPKYALVGSGPFAQRCYRCCLYSPHSYWNIDVGKNVWTVNGLLLLHLPPDSYLVDWIPHVWSSQAARTRLQHGRADLNLDFSQISLTYGNKMCFFYVSGKKFKEQLIKNVKKEVCNFRLIVCMRHTANIYALQIFFIFNSIYYYIRVRRMLHTRH